MIKSIAFTILFILLAGCSSTTIDPMEFAGQFKDKFNTQIKGDGIKLFVYQAKLATASDRNINDGPAHQQRIDRRMQDARSYAQEMREKEEFLAIWTEQVQVGLNKTIEMTGYCKQGYIELSRYIENERGEIRGECNDGATAEDISQFGR
ncbi:hypothetical protein [Shewanella sp. OMA3-2]|uniref:hypothetical protein n=1 Tax=Shewanella sp. OMA3-2 TaxID=2908650 RepID=UPI001F329E2B|nr:hypothetical protein [Shewanella sp. OMA3-2]UJF20624.1 hypothetical protein L0B17_10445 [Shewanella sp. OMA3-2]